jgi:replicative DNA helicase
MSNELRLPPQNVEAEQSLLGSILINKDALIQVGDIVIAEDFYTEKHQKIYEAMINLYEKREPIDVLTVSNRLEEKKQLEAVGGRSYIVTLSNAVPTASHALQYAKIVSKKATLRNLINVANQITTLGYEQNEDVEKVLDEAEQKLFKVSQGHLKQGFFSVQSVLGDTFDRIDKLHKNKGKIRGIPTGFVDLDKITGGLQKSDLIILAARPGVGKTTFALDLMRHIAIREKKSVGFFSLEMSRDQLVDRILSAEAGLPLYKIRNGQLSDAPESDDFPRLGHAMGALSESKIYIDDLGSANIMEVRTKARRLQMEHGLDFLVIDYLQLMEGRANSESRVQEISEISRGLKQIAKELDVPILALSQLNRSVEQRNPPIPKLADLRESGSIEQDADIVMFIYRESVYNKNLEFDRKHLAELHLSKHRNGPTDTIQMFFDHEKVSYRNLDKKFASQAPPPSDKPIPGYGAASDSNLPSFKS